MTRPSELSSHVAAFCALLRTEYGFAVGYAETRDALRAVEFASVTDAVKFRAALRLVCCGNFEELAPFERAFDAYFAERGIAQPAYAPRHTRPAADAAPRAPAAAPRARERAAEADDAPGDALPGAELRPESDGADAATAWQTLRARYSPTAASSAPPEPGAEGFADMLAAASRIIASVRLGRSRRWKALERGGRFDLRRTLRASLQTGGDAARVWTFGHPPRRPRFVVLVDGSRSMADSTGAIVQFARALALRSSRASVFFFSTALRDVTRELRAPGPAAARLHDLGEAWGGGTKIGASLAAFASGHGRRLLTHETICIVYSDGLDVGDVAELERALADIERRCAAVVWLNPHAASPGFTPAARAMRAALPFIRVLAAANDAAAFNVLARTLAREPRIRGRRR